MDLTSRPERALEENIMKTSGHIQPSVESLCDQENLCHTSINPSGRRYLFKSGGNKVYRHLRSIRETLAAVKRLLKHICRGSNSLMQSHNSLQFRVIMFFFFLKKERLCIFQKDYWLIKYVRLHPVFACSY